MAELDVNVAREEFDTTLKRVTNGKERIILTDQGKPVAVLAPADGEETTGPVGPDQQYLNELLAAGRSHREQLLAQGSTPDEAAKDDPAWQRKWDQLRAYFGGLVPPDVTLEEIEADLRETREELRRERRARSG